MLGRLILILLALVGLVAITAVVSYFVLRRADIPYETLASKYETPASRYIDLPSGVRMHYKEEGPTNGAGAHTLLLIHGYTASTETWDPWVARLSDAYHIVRIDLPGHGLTRAPAGYQGTIENFRDSVEEFARAMNLERFAIGGNSMGGNVAWEYALAHPERVDALILVDAAGWPPPANDPHELLVFKLLKDPTARALLRDLDNTALMREGLQASFVDPARATDAMVQRYVDYSRAPGHREIILQIGEGFEARNFATPERLAPLAMPTLVMHGAEDHLIPVTSADAFHDAIAGSQIFIFDGAGHVLQEDAPDGSASTARTFLQSVYSDRSEQAAAAQ